MTGEINWPHLLILQAERQKTSSGGGVLIIPMYNCYIFKGFAVFPNKGFLVSEIQLKFE